MKGNHIIYSAFSAIVALSLATVAQAKTVEVLGITHDGTSAQIKARLNTDGKDILTARAISFNMTDGYSITSRSYTVVEDEGNKYFSADIVYYPDNDGYTYRIELDFTDGTRYRSEVVNLDLTEAFMWLSDYKWTDYKGGWDAQHPPVNDGEVDPTLKMTLDGIVYYKGVSNHGEGFLEYNFTEITDVRTFTKFYTKYGVQDDRPDGEIKFSFLTDGNYHLENKLMYSKSNPNRKDLPCIEEIEFPMNDVKTLKIEEKLLDNNWGAHANLVMSRLYVDAPSVDGKESQTVTFVSEGGNLTQATTLNATSSSGGKVFYSIVSGENLATIDGNLIKPVWGGKGHVVVEATQYGDSKYYPAVSRLEFDVDMHPRAEILGIYRPTVPTADNRAYVYILLDTKSKGLKSLKATIYDNLRTLNMVGQSDLLNQFNMSKGGRVVQLAVPNYDDQVVALEYCYEDSETTIKLPYWHSEGSFDYVSDFPSSHYTVVMGYGSFPGANHPYNKMNGDVMEIGDGSISLQKYAKGFGIHATGYVDVAPAYLSSYDRIGTDIGAQKDSNKSHSNQVLTFRLVNGNTTLVAVENVNKPGMQRWIYPINNQQNVRMVGDQGSDNNGNDYVCLGASRLYYTRPAKSSQSITWDSSRKLISNKAVSIDLGATSESGFPILYYIVQGGEYARIEDNRLMIYDFPKGGGEIIVDAVQPGNDIWAPSAVASCVFTLARGLEVQRNEYIEVSGSDVFDELIIHADKSGSGQVNVKKGLLDVRTLILKYTLVPGEWTHVAFPAEADLDRISDMRDLGYTFNAYGVPGYYLMELDTENFAATSGETGWISLSSPKVKRNRGYLLKVDARNGEDTVEVTFTIENTSVDLTEVIHMLGLSLDFTEMQPDTYQVTVASANPAVLSNNLTIEVKYDPADLAAVPVNHEKALDNMRFIFVNGHKAIRLTLPDPQPAKVVFFDRKGEKVLKAVRYVAPNVIDLGDLRSGKYYMLVNYGAATKTYEIEL